MNTSLTVRKSIVLTLAVLVIFLAAAAFLKSSQHPASTVSQQVSNKSAFLGVSPDSGTSALKIPVINPRVRFAPLGGRKTPATMLGGRKPPPAALSGRKTPATMLGGRKPPPAALANPFTAQAAPLTLVDGLILLALAALLLVPARKPSLQCK